MRAAALSGLRLELSLGPQQPQAGVRRLTLSHRRGATSERGKQRPAGTEPGPAPGTEQDRGHCDNETQQYSVQLTPVRHGSRTGY